ncbi:MAG TPA: dolichyl-phosphate beta-glucosyltransferase, partial [Thermodesulfovibrionales bacterium]|nr:dolichyl-phosphate beta-glucosyltransferase [Thermodesulfovibrionales bacterium]
EGKAALFTLGRPVSYTYKKIGLVRPFMNSASKRSGQEQGTFLSIIIPSFNEAGRLPATLDRIVAFVRAQRFVSEVIVVDNASDDTTKEVVMEFCSRHPFVKYLYEAVRGKGAAVRTGMLAGQGEYLLICDADLAVPIEEVVKFLPPRLQDYDVAIGSREAEGAKRHNEPWHRHLMGRVFNLIVRMLVLPGLQDTQCGFKCFRHEIARDLFSASRIDGWSFDVEVLCFARLKGYRIAEVPVEWYYGDKSKVSPARDTWRMLKEVLRIWKNAKR